MDYFAEELLDPAVPVRITKDTNLRLGSPVVFRVAPMTVDEALAGGIITSFAAEEGLTQDQISRSPLRAGNNNITCSI